MVREKSDLQVTVPSFFKCPISMDVMKSPVSLCTGVTYDRSSITTWLDSGHNTCPATMQVLHSTDVVPNLTLRRLIRVWSDSQLLLRPPPSDSVASLFAPAISKQQILNSFKCIKETNTSITYSNSLFKIIDFGKYSDENREFLARIDEFVPILVDVMINVDKIEVIELVISVLDLIRSETGIKEQLHKSIIKCDPDHLSPFVLVLQKGNLNAKIQSARILSSIAFNDESQRKITEKQGLLYELYNLVNSETDLTASGTGLSTLIALSPSRPVKKDLIRFGIVRTAAKIVSGFLSGSELDVIENALKVLEMVSTCTEGRSAICSDEICVSAIVKSLMKVSSVATEHGITVVWSVCYLARDQMAQNAVMKSNGLTKVLLVMQSSCSSLVRQMCGDLVKVFRVNSKSCLASYETRTTHITPY
ncbi:hypothetical protein LguiA_018327 [Lonicera macranthoides]